MIFFGIFGFTHFLTEISYFFFFFFWVFWIFFFYKFKDFVLTAKTMKIISHDTQNLVKPPQDPPNKLDYFKKTFVNQSLRSWKFFIGEGNNGEIVRRIINETRGGWWREAKEIKGIINFKWQQNTREFKYERMTANALYKQIVNHFEFHREISTKAGLVKNLKSYCQVKNLFFLNFDFFFFFINVFLILFL